MKLSNEAEKALREVITDRIGRIDHATFNGAKVENLEREKAALRHVLSYLEKPKESHITLVTISVRELQRLVKSTLISPLLNADSKIMLLVDSSGLRPNEPAPQIRLASESGDELYAWTSEIEVQWE